MKAQDMDSGWEQELMPKDGWTWLFNSGKSILINKLLKTSDVKEHFADIKVHGDRYSGSSAKLINR